MAVADRPFPVRAGGGEYGSDISRLVLPGAPVARPSVGAQISRANHPRTWVAGRPPPLTQGRRVKHPPALRRRLRPVCAVCREARLTAQPAAGGLRFTRARWRRESGFESTSKRQGLSRDGKRRSSGRAPTAAVPRCGNAALPMRPTHLQTRRGLPRGRVSRRSRGPLLGGMRLSSRTWYGHRLSTPKLAAGGDRSQRGAQRPRRAASIAETRGPTRPGAGGSGRALTQAAPPSWPPSRSDASRSGPAGRYS